MNFIKYYFNRPIILFLLAFVTGIILPRGAGIGQVLILPALAVILTIALLRMPRGFFRHPGPLVVPVIWGNVMNYLILGNVIILLSIFLIRDENLWIGMVLIAAVPPAASVLSLSKSFAADQKTAFAGFAGAYAGAILIAPLMGMAFLKYIPLNYADVIRLLLGLIVLPLIFSRLVVDRNWDRIFVPYKEIINEWCFFIVSYTLVASNRYPLFHHPLDLLFIILIAVINTFMLGYIIKKICIFFKISQGKTTSLLLLGTMKNFGLAGGIALIVFKNEAAIPSIIFIFCLFIYELWLKYKSRKIRAAENNL